MENNIYGNYFGNFEQTYEISIEDKFSIYYNEIFNLFNIWIATLQEKIYQMKQTQNPIEIETSILETNKELISKNQEYIEKLKEKFIEESHSLKIYFESLALQVELDKKNLEIQALIQDKISNETTGYDETNDSLSKNLEILNNENMNLKVRAVEVELKNDLLLRLIEEKESKEKTLIEENQKKTELVFDLQQKLEIMLNENEKLTRIINDKNDYIEKTKKEIQIQQKEKNSLLASFEQNNYKNHESFQIELSKIEMKSKKLILQNAKLAENVMKLAKELEEKHNSIYKATQITDYLTNNNQDLTEKLKIVISLNERLNEILLINMEEISYLNREKNKLKKRDETISSLLKENNDLRSYLNVNFIDLEEKNMLKLVVQQNEQELRSLREENKKLMNISEINKKSGLKYSLNQNHHEEKT